jgi:hypothetical protein
MPEIHLAIEQLCSLVGTLDHLAEVKGRAESLPSQTPHWIRLLERRLLEH